MRSPVFRRPGCRRHAGTTKRHPNMPPRRWWQAVIAPHNHVAHKMIHTSPRRKHSPAPPPGCDLGGAIWHAPHVATTPRGEIRGYAQRQPPTGVGNYIAFCHLLIPGRSSDDSFSAQTLHLPRYTGAASAPRRRRRLPQSGFPVHIPALTKLCRDRVIDRENACQRYAP